MRTSNLHTTSKIITYFFWVNPFWLNPLFLFSTERSFSKVWIKSLPCWDLYWILTVRINMNSFPLSNDFTWFFSDHMFLHSPCYSLCFSTMHLFLLLQIPFSGAPHLLFLSFHMPSWGPFLLIICLSADVKSSGRRSLTTFTKAGPQLHASHSLSPDASLALSWVTFVCVVSQLSRKCTILICFQWPLYLTRSRCL